MSTPHAVSSSAASTPAFSQERKRFAKRSSPARSTCQMAGLACNECSKASRRIAGGAVAGTTDVDASARGVAVPSCAGGVGHRTGIYSCRTTALLHAWRHPACEPVLLAVQDPSLRLSHGIRDRLTKGSDEFGNFCSCCRCCGSRNGRGIAYPRKHC
ncbi:hypothetical protein BGW80DRAFT_1316122 [Lactifluus volemus]|nr:hypothetical protein BGW80DRAFT_1316122 [Lactifluus volemus]